MAQILCRTSCRNFFEPPNLSIGCIFRHKGVSTISRPSSSLIKENKCCTSVTSTSLSVPENARHAKKFNDIPGPSGLCKIPFLGMAFLFKPFGQYSGSTYHILLRDLHTKYGGIAKVRLGYSWKIFLFDPNDIRKVFYNDEKYPYRNESALMKCYAKRKGVEAGLAFQNGKKWSELRKPIQEKLLRPCSVDQYIPVLSQIADEFTNLVGEQGCMSNTLSDITRLSMEYTGVLCFNKRLGFLNPSADIDEFTESVEAMLDCLARSFDSIPLYKLYRTAFYERFETAYDHIRSMCHLWLNDSDKNDGDCSFLSAMISDPRMPKEHLLSVLVDLFVAGVDATGNMLTFAIYHLAKNQTAQDRLHKELRDASSKTTVPDGKLMNLQYLKSCVKETFRLVPPVRDGTRRVLSKDMVLAGYKIPRGTDIILCSSVTGLSSRWFPDPKSYRPERWLRAGTERSSIHPFAILPFGFGPRKCVGQRFAELQMYICLMKLVENYRLVLDSPDTNIDVMYKLFASPDAPFFVRVEKRN